MDGRGRLGARNWEFSDRTGHAESDPEQAAAISVAPLRMSSYPHRDALIGQHHSDVSAVHFTWVPQRNFLSHSKDLNQPHATAVSSEMIEIQSMPIAAENTTSNGEVEAKPPKVKKRRPSAKKANRVANKAMRPKEPKKQSAVATKKKGSSVSTGKTEKKNEDIIAKGIMLDFSNVPVPVCSCTGVPRRCYRWGAGGWQSSCCTTTISEYPLPMSPSRRSARVAGRKMSIGAYAKLLQRLAAEGHDLSFAVDLKDHWARHGTNKFVTIR